MRRGLGTAPYERLPAAPTRAPAAGGSADLEAAQLRASPRPPRAGRGEARCAQAAPRSPTPGRGLTCGAQVGSSPVTGAGPRRRGRAASPGRAGDRGAQAGRPPAGRGRRALAMAGRRFSQLLRTLVSARAGHRYEPLRRAEGDSSVSVGARAPLARPGAPGRQPILRMRIRGRGRCNLPLAGTRLADDPGRDVAWVPLTAETRNSCVSTPKLPYGFFKVT